MGKNILDSTSQKISLPWISVLLITSILIVAASWIGCGGDGANEGPVTFSLRVVGEEEVVFDWTADRCEDLDVPDLPTRAFRDDSGQVQMIASHFTVRRNIGPDLNNLTHECGIVLASDRDPDPAAFNDAEWIGSTYTEDGKTIYAILHNEYHGWEHSGQCFTQFQFWLKCWYNGLTLAVSTDSGASYQHPVMPPEHLIAAYPEQYIPDVGPYGIFHPSNIVKGKDGFYYSIVHLVRPFGEDGWACLMRTHDLSDPKSWRFWDGSGFDGTFINPYTDETNDSEAHVCSSVHIALTSSLTYNNYIDRYVLLGPGGGGESSGFYYALSKDLINWTPFKLFYHVELPWTADNPEDTVYLYPSLLDPDSDTRNFETAGKTAYLYYTRLNFGQGNLDRDLLRIPVEFFME